MEILGYILLLAFTFGMLLATIATMYDSEINQCKSNVSSFDIMFLVFFTIFCISAYNCYELFPFGMK